MNQADLSPGQVNKISERLAELTAAVNSASASSARLARALNVLTAIGTLIAATALWRTWG